MREKPPSPARSRLPRAWILAALWAAWPAFAEVATPIELPQADGGALTLEAPASRLVTLSPHLAELVFAAGAGDKLAATVAYSNYPPQVTELPLVGDAFRVDIERVHQLDPDLVIAWQSGNPPDALAQLADLGFRVWVVEILEPGEIADVVEAIGRASATTDIAEASASQIRDRIAALQRRYDGREAVDYFYQVASRPLYTVNGEHLISRSLALCGGVNVFAGLEGLAPQIGLEAVLQADPRALIAPSLAGQQAPLEHWKAWPRLRAVEQGNFILLPADEISRATPRFIDAVELACAMLDDLRQPGETP